MRLKNNAKFEKPWEWEELKEDTYFLNKENFLATENFFIDEHDFAYETEIVNAIENKNKNLKKLCKRINV